MALEAKKQVDQDGRRLPDLISIRILALGVIRMPIRRNAENPHSEILIRSGGLVSA